MEEEVAPLVLAAEMKDVEGRTRFQKLLFLVEVKARRDGRFSTGYHFDLYLYGPYSRQLSRTIDQLVATGRLAESRELTASGNLRCNYRLTPAGQRAVRDLVSHGMVPLPLSQAVHEVASQFGPMALPDLVKAAYASFGVNRD
jgi:uncharacterized protein YwgA